MKFTCSREALAGALKRVLPACPGNSTVPILTHVLLEVEGDRLTLTATDLEIRLSDGIGIEAGESGGKVAAEDGAITVPGKLLAGLVGKMPDYPVKAEVSEANAGGTHLVLTAGEAEYTLYGLPAEEYPAAPLPEGMRTLLLPGPLLQEMIRRTHYAISSDISKAVLNGALFRWEPERQTPSPQPPPNTGEGEKEPVGMATMAATDTHRLAVDRQPVTGEGESGGKVAAEAIEAIIPGRALAEMARAIGKSENSVALMFGKEQVALQAGGLLLCCRLIEGNFPRFERTLRTDSPSRIHIDPGGLRGAIDRAGLVARAESNKVILEMREEADRLTMTARTEVGQARETLPARIKGPSVEIGFNAEYLHDALGVLDTTEIEMALDGPTAPAVITGTDIEGYTCLVMPMQVM